MFKYIFVLLALVAAAFASPKPQYFYPGSASYATYSSFAKPAAAVYSTGYVPTAYSSSYIAPAAYSAAAYPAYAYL
ncbi:hypothetical protein quinque_012032 [Culex quinquefasciatus]|uniref:Uncharacterized protein n=2 Tax=Culex pipiens complex TaxID=518105 RepID=A0A1S4KIA3_CULQU